jgi:hypothetical protein
LRLSFLPVILEKVEVHSLLGVFFEHFFIQGDANPGPEGREEAAPTTQGLQAQMLHIRFAEVVEVFLNLEIRSAGGQV